MGARNGEIRLPLWNSIWLIPLYYSQQWHPRAAPRQTRGGEWCARGAGAPHPATRGGRGHWKERVQTGLNRPVRWKNGRGTGNKGVRHVRNKRARYYTTRAGMARAPNKCGWLMRGRKESCGKRCYGAYCGQHYYQLKKGMRMPEPCRVCGIGLLCDYRLCKRCGGGALKQRLYRKREKAKKPFQLVLLELQERNTPVREM